MSSRSRRWWREQRQQHWPNSFTIRHGTPNINHLPAEIRGAVLAKCPARPDAGHYFATYYHDEGHLHFEHLHCGSSFCNASDCLHETYRLTSGHYHLVESI